MGTLYDRVKKNNQTSSLSKFGEVNLRDPLGVTARIQQSSISSPIQKIDLKSKSSLYDRVKNRVTAKESGVDLRDPLGVDKLIQGATAFQRKKTDIQRLSERDMTKDVISQAPERSGFMKALDFLRERQPSRATPLVKEFAQGSMRDLTALIRGGETITPQTLEEKAIFGDKPFNLETVGREYASIVGKGEEVGKRTAMGIGVFAGLLSLPSKGFGLIKESSKLLSKTDDLRVIKNELKRIGVKGSDNELKALSDVLKAENNAKVIEDILTSLQKGDTSIYNKVAAKAGADDIPEELAAEARKYKSAEEFVDEYTARGLLDLSLPEKHRFGRIFDAAEDGRIMDTVDTVKQYSQDISYYPEANIPRVKSGDELVTIYRGTRKAQKDLLPGDFVSFSKNYALSHNEGENLLSKSVPAKDVIWQGNDFSEWVYSPESIRKQYSKGLESIWEKATAKTLPTPPGLPKVQQAPVTPETRSLIKAAEQEGQLPTQQKGIKNLNERRLALDFQREALENDPARALAKYAGRDGLPEVTGKGSEFGKRGDDIVTELGFDSTEEARDAYLKYRNKKRSFDAERRTLSEDLKTVRLQDKQLKDFEKALRPIEKLTKKVAKAVTRQVKGVEQRAAKRQVAFEKREAARKVQKAKEEILTKLRTAQSASEDIKKNITDYVKNNLDPKDRGKANVLIRDAKTEKDLTKAFARINRWAENAEKTALRNDILKTQKQIMKSPSVAVDYQDKIKELMGDFELKGHRESTLERLKKIQKFLEDEAKAGKDIEMPRRVLKSLELLNRTPFEEITINQLQGLKAEMELLEDLGRTKLRTTKNIWELNKSKILDEVAIQKVEPLNKIELLKPEIGERLTVTQKFKNLVFSTMNQAARIDKAISPMDTVFDLLDGGLGTYSGANFRFFKGQVDAGYGRYITRKDALQNPVVDLATKNKLNDTNFERMGVVAAREQDGGMEKLIASGYTEEQVNAVKLSTQEQKVLDLMRKTMDSQFPEIQDTMRRVYNKPVEKVKNYFSFMTDWKAMNETEVFARFGSQDPAQYGAPRKNVEAGFAISRVGGDQKIKINALEVFMQHTDNTSYLLEVGETSKMLGEVAASPKYAELVGEVGQLMVREWIDVVARKGGAAGASEIAVLNTLRRNVGAGILGLKLSTVAIQPTALIDGMGFIGVKYGTKGVANFAGSSQWRKYIADMPEIKDRMGGEFALRELTDDGWLQNIQRKGFIPLQTLDQLTAGAVAAGAYQRKMVELGEVIDLTKPYNPEALAYAQLAVRRTQSSGAFKDVPLAISRGALTGNRSLDRAILQFQNFLLTRWSRIRHDVIRAGINTKDPTKAIPVFTAIIFASLAASGSRIGVNKVQDFITGREDEDSVAEDLKKGMMYELTGNVPFLGTAISMAMYDGEMFPILDAPKGIVSGLNRVITSKSESAKLRGLTEFAGSMGAILGVPGSAQTEQLIRGSLQDKKSSSRSGGGGLKTPPGLPKLPSVKNSLPTPPGLPALP